MVLFVPTSWRKRAFSRSNSAAAAAWWAACLWWARAGGPEASLERSRESAAFRSAPAVSIGSDRVCMKSKMESSCAGTQPVRPQEQEPVLLLAVKRPRLFMQDRGPSVHIDHVNA